MKIQKFISGIIASLFLANLAIADTSTNYKIDISELNATGTVSSSTNYKTNSATIGFIDGNMGYSASFTLGSGLPYLELWCGNGIMEFGETCDDGNLANGDGCSSICKFEGAGPVCGNTVRELGEQCDDGNILNGDGCDSVCRNEVCGNGFLQTGETCDDGNLANGDGCSNLCVIEVALFVCGNGAVEAGEQCDDGNLANGDGCSSSCATEGGGSGGGGYRSVCGNNIKESGEYCDDGNTTSGDGCSTVCQTESPQAIVCGNGIRQVGEQCDDGNKVSKDGCSATCQTETSQGIVCGNGVKEGNEECDDGDRINENECNNLCKKRSIFQLPVCGNKIKESGEQCDDGNKLNGDGCDSTCKLKTPEEGEKIVREIRIIAHPEKRVNAPNNWGTLGKLIFYNKTLQKTSLTLTLQMNDSGWGVFSTDKLEEGMYDISFKGRSHLTKVIRDVAIDQTAETLDFSFGGTYFLVAGDVHESKDDFILGLDIASTVNALYSSSLDADLNHDGLVNGLDLSIVVGNIYRMGEKIKI